jgi:CBS domain containing-hemolysin-like protein
LFGVELPEDDDVETIGGLLARELGRVPIEGASAEIGGLRLVAESRGGRRNQIDTMLVCRVEQPSDDAPEDPRGSSGRGATRPDVPAPVEG